MHSWNDLKTECLKFQTDFYNEASFLFVMWTGSSDYRLSKGTDLVLLFELKFMVTLIITFSKVERKITKIRGNENLKNSKNHFSKAILFSSKKKKKKERKRNPLNLIYPACFSRNEDTTTTRRINYFISIFF